MTSTAGSAVVADGADAAEDEASRIAGNISLRMAGRFSNCSGG
jgi:hypothetical protein